MNKSTEIRATTAFDPLKLTDLSVNNAQVDAELLTAVYPVEAAWVGMQPLISRGDAVSINGTSATISDTSCNTHIRPDTGPPLEENNRYYTAISLQLDGTGTVNPIKVRVLIQSGTSANEVYAVSATNPARTFIGPLFVPAGTTLNVNNTVNGGSGVTMGISLYGWQAGPGVPLPLTPSPAVIGSY